METKFSLEKLNNVNYFTWKLKMKLFLIKEDLWDVITGERPTSEYSTQNFVQRWTKRDQRALAFIGLALEDSQLIHLRDKDNALDCWKALQEAHEKDTITNKISLYKRIALHRMIENTSMEDHLNEMMNLFQKLSDLGAPASDEWKIGMIFTSLPSTYSTLITALEARDEKDLKLSLVQSKLLDEYMRQQESNSSWNDTEKLLAMKSNQDRTFCHICKKENHKMKNCYKLKEFQVFQKFKQFVKRENEETDQANSLIQREEENQMNYYSV